MRVAGICKLRGCGGGMSHGHQRNTKMRIRVHREPQAEGATDFSQVLYLLDTAPIMRVAEYYLNGVGSDALGQIGKSSHRDVACQRRLHAGIEQLLPSMCHSGDRRCGIFEVAAVAKLFAESFSDFDGRLDRPRAIRIEPNRYRGTELCAKLTDGLNLLCRFEHPGFELDFAKSVFREHLLDLGDKLFRRERLAVLVFAGILALAASAFVFVERIRREWDFAARSSTKQVASRLAYGSADQIKTCYFDRRIKPCRFVGRILAGNVVGLRAVSRFGAG